MAREGAVIVGVDNNQERLDKTVAEIAAAGGKAHGRLCNALDKDAVDALVALVAKEFGRIDILVNAVGGSTIIPRPSATVDELSLDDWKAIIDFNLDGTFLFTHAVVPIMKRQRSGKIVNLSSIAGRGRSVASSAAYAAAKGGIIAFSSATSSGPMASTSTRSRRAPRSPNASARIGSGAARRTRRARSTTHRCAASPRRPTRRG
jgi:NAD(P)-dependent dehydrogenase (short-subunit alcohol dehydrogenase family)